jgi:hypothetical protein
MYTSSPLFPRSGESQCQFYVDGRITVYGRLFLPFLENTEPNEITYPYA